MTAESKIIVIGGSAGSLPVLAALLNALPPNFAVPVVIVLHRQKNVQSEMNKILARYAPLKTIIEPDDKEAIREGCIYLAPQNYHLLLEYDATFGLDYSEAVLYSRPSIDVTFESVAKVFRQHAVAILLSGSNRDGSIGLEKILQQGGTAIVQSPDTAEYKVMPEAALNRNPSALSLHPDKMVTFVLSLNELNVANENGKTP